jgi:GNAT superfamily N-acetyltransferase
LDSEITFGSGRRGDLAKEITDLHMSFYEKASGFDHLFEQVVHSGLGEFLSRLTNSRNQIWHLRNQEGLLGSIAIDGEDLGPGIAHLRWFIVDQRLAGQGWGKKLLSQAVDFCVRSKFDEIQLWTFQGLDAARNLYEMNRFSLVEEDQGNQWGDVVLEQKFVRCL